MRRDYRYSHCIYPKTQNFLLANFTFTITFPLAQETLFTIPSPLTLIFTFIL